VRKLAYILPLLLFATNVFAVTKKPVKKKLAHAGHVTRRYSPPKVYVSPMMQRMAFEAVSERAVHQASALEGAAGWCHSLNRFLIRKERIAAHSAVRRFTHRLGRLGRYDARGRSNRNSAQAGRALHWRGIHSWDIAALDIRGNNSRGWYTDGLVGRKGDGSYGLGGVSLTAKSLGENLFRCPQLVNKLNCTICSSPMAGLRIRGGRRGSGHNRFRRPTGARYLPLCAHAWRS